MGRVIAMTLTQTSIHLHMRETSAVTTAVSVMIARTMTATDIGTCRIRTVEPCLGSPIVIDTQGNGFALVGLEAGVQFDIFGDGKPILLGWVQGDDALLVLDRNGNGLIDSGLELFGNHTRLQSGRRAENGYQALAEFDVNGDSVIDERDPVFSGLRLWLDRNVNGVTDAGELTTLADHGISGLDLSYRESRKRD